MTNTIRRITLVLLVLLSTTLLCAAQDTTEVTVLGSIKPEILEPFTEAVETFNASQDAYTITSIPLESGGDALQRLTTLSASGNMPTIATMGQEFALFQDTLCDLTDTEFSQHAYEGMQDNVTVDGHVYGMPVTIEAFGLLYNKAVLDEAVGGDFDPASITTRTDLAELLAQVDALDSTEAAVHVSPLDWSLGAHLTNILYTDQSTDSAERAAFLKSLKAGEVDLAENEVYNGWMDTIDLLLQYNQNARSPLAADYDGGVLALSTGEVGFWFMGNWALPNLLEFNPDVDYGILPLPISDDPETYGNTQISVGVPMSFVVDCGQSTPEQQAGAIAFINWFVTDPVGQEIWVNNFQFLPVYDTFEIQPEDALSQQILGYVADGKSLEWMNNQYPAGGWQDMGTSMQRYLAGDLDRAGLADALEAYWGSVEETEG